MTADPPAVPISDDELIRRMAAAERPMRSLVLANECLVRNQEIDVFSILLARLSAAEARAARAEVAAFNKGIEAAAGKVASQISTTAAIPVRMSPAMRELVCVRIDGLDGALTAIRALTRSAPATGQDTPPGESDV